MDCVEHVETTEYVLAGNLIHAVEDEVLSASLQTHMVQQEAKWYAGPFSDCTPALIATMHGDLTLRGH